MTKAKHAGISPAFVETVAGLLAGSTATLIVHPLDVVKTRMQSKIFSNPYVPELTVLRVHRSSTASASSPLTTVSLLRGLLATDAPLASFYRGLMPNIVGNTTSWASFFLLKSQFEKLLVHRSQPAALSPPDYFAASLCAGAATQLITNPVWVLKTRMLSSDRAAAGAYPNMWYGARALWAAEGVRGFYRGLTVGMLAVSHGAVQFAVYDPARRLWMRRRRPPLERESSCLDQGVSNEATVVLSTVAKLVAGAVTYPLQVLRSRLQNYDAEARFGRGIHGVVGRLWREEGVRGFYRGMVPGVVRVLPATWVTFLVYENVKHYLPRWAS